MKWFLPSLVSYIEGHYSHIECIIKQGKDEENAEFLTVWNILKEFFRNIRLTFQKSYKYMKKIRLNF